MPSGQPTHNEATRNEPVWAGWTGRLVIGVALYTAIAVLVMLFGPQRGPVIDYFNVLAHAPLSLAAVALAFTAARRATTRDAQYAWILLGSAFGLYGVGDLLKSAFWLAGVDPFPSVADLFLVAFFPVMFAAMVSIGSASGMQVPWARLTLDSLILNIAFGAFFWFFSILPAAEVLDVPVQFALTQVYIGLNSFLLVGFSVLLINDKRGPLRHISLLIMAQGFSTMFLANILWAMSRIDGSYHPGGLADALHLIGYFGLLAAVREELRGQARETEVARARGAALAHALPYVAMLLSFAVLVYFTRDTADDPATAMTVIIFVLTLMVMARQGVIFSDDARLREQRAAGRVEARYASLIGNATDVMMIADPDGRLRFVSAAAERYFGLHPDHLIGRSLLEAWKDPDSDKLAAFLQEISASRGHPVGPVEICVASGSRRLTLEGIGSNLLADPDVAGLSLNFRDISERKVLEEQLRQLAFHDPLTLLANRSLFRNRVEHALALAERSQAQIAVMFLDLDNFKNVNDSLGHDAGDRLLQAAAQRLINGTRATDTVARLGGDEFGVLLEGIGDVHHVEQIASALNASFGEPLQLDGGHAHVGTSIGVALSDPGDTTEQLLRNADIAMYTAKAEGKGRYAVFRPHMQQKLHERLRLEEDIIHAIARHEFFLDYQPVIDLKTGELLGVEALLRWRHPTQGLILPTQFVSVAEECGQIIELGRWVLIEACRQVRAWREAIASGSGVRVAVNISGRHLQGGDLVADVREALRVSGMEPDNLVIELTESTIMQNTEANLARLRALKDLGVRLAIDDFGTGYSSLSYLHRFPIDILKIDRSFVSRLTEAGDGPELARAVVMLGETLGLETVAEGIEQGNQAAALLALGCVAGQGFHFAPAGPLQALTTSAFALRRAELRRWDAGYDHLTATGRYRVASRSVA